MSQNSNRLLAAASSPLSHLALKPQSAVTVTHNLRWSGIGGKFWPDEATIQLSGDRRTLSVSVRRGSISQSQIEVWRLTDGRPAVGGRELPALRTPSFIVVLADTPPGITKSGAFTKNFDLTLSETFSGSVDADWLRASGIPVQDAEQTCIDGTYLATPSAEKGVSLLPNVSRMGMPHRNAGRATTLRDRAPVKVRKSQRSTGSFSTRGELTARVWAMRRQQVVPNLAAIARECAVNPEIVKLIICDQEGLDTYLQTGSLLG